MANDFVQSANNIENPTPSKILNFYRNCYYTEGHHTERGLIAEAINALFNEMIALGYNFDNPDAVTHKNAVLQGLENMREFDGHGGGIQYTEDDNNYTVDQMIYEIKVGSSVGNKFLMSVYDIILTYMAKFTQNEPDYSTEDLIPDSPIIRITVDDNDFGELMEKFMSRLEFYPIKDSETYIEDSAKWHLMYHEQNYSEDLKVFIVDTIKKAFEQHISSLDVETQEYLLNCFECSFVETMNCKWQNGEVYYFLPKAQNTKWVNF